MSLQNLDLDIQNYSIEDLELFFQLGKNTKYTSSDVDKKEFEIREKLLKSGHIDKRFKRDLIDFLNKAKQIIIDERCKPLRKPSVIPKNYKLDNLDVPLSRIEEPNSRESNLIIRPETQYVNAFNSEYYPGDINPLKTRIITKCLTIDTRFRTNYDKTTSSDFTIQLPLKLNKVVSMQMSSFEIPVAFYGISAYYGNNVFYMSIVHQTDAYDDIPVEIEKKIVVPDGNYNAQDFIDTINNILSPKNFDGSIKNPEDLFSYVVFSIDILESGSGTGKVKIGTSGSLACKIMEIKMDFSKNNAGINDGKPIQHKIGWNLGFLKENYEGKTAYVSETIIEPASIRYIYLAIDDFNNSVNNNFITAFNESVLSPNILARISIKGAYFTLLMENDLNIVTEPRKYFGPVDIQRLRIRLFDDYGRVLDMNGANYSFCLIFKMLYDL